MKKFAGNKPIETILAQCKAQGVPVDMRKFRDEGSDYITIGTPGLGHILYNTFNGTFLGRTPDGIEFNSNTADHDDQLWMQALLAFVYVELPID